MKEITAFIKPHKLSGVTIALQRVEGLCGMSVVDVKGFGRRPETDAPHPSVDDLMDFATYVKIEIFCHDELIEDIVTTIQKTAYTGLRGDGRIFISNVERELKIGTEEQGESKI